MKLSTATGQLHTEELDSGSSTALWLESSDCKTYVKQPRFLALKNSEGNGFIKLDKCNSEKQVLGYIFVYILNAHC